MSASELAERIFEKQSRDPIVVMGIGLPGTDKTEVLRPLAEEFEPIALYLSRKAVENMVLRDQPELCELSRNIVDRTVWARLYCSVGEYLGAGGSIIVDATHTSEKRRQESIKQYYKRGASGVVGAYFTVTNPDTALQRLQISMNANNFASMINNLRLRPPSLREGFSDIIHINSDELPPKLV